MAREFNVEGHVLNITCSIGISMFPDHGTDSAALTKTADLAMNCAKENGRNNFCFFTPEVNARAEERLALENSLRGALEREELYLVYQPQVEIASGKMIGMEALLRWRHPELGLVPPDKFIPIAEDTGLIVPIGEWVLKTACAQVRRWQELRLPALPVAVNVSALQLRQERFLQAVRRVLNETGLAPQYLELELTERVLLSDAENSRATLQELARMGLRLSIDDLGTGYSSLSYLKDLPVSKIENRSFVYTGLDRRPTRRGDYRRLDQHGTQPEPGGARRRSGDRGTDVFPARPQLRSNSGVTIQQALGRRGLRGEVTRVAAAAGLG